MKQSHKLTWKIYLAGAFVFLLILAFFFKDFLFDPDTILVTKDQFKGFGYRFLRQTPFLSQWNPYILGGMPTLDASYGDAWHPLVFLHMIMDPARAVGVKFIACVFIAFLSGTLLFSYLVRDWRGGMLLGMLFSLNPQFFTHIYGGHDGKMMVVSVAPLGILGLLKISRDGKIYGILLIALAVAWMIVSSHIQLAYFFLWGLLFFSIYENFLHNRTTPMSTRFIRQAWVGAGVGIALLLGAIQIIPPYIYTTQQSVRGEGSRTTFGHAVSWSLHQEEVLSMLQPAFAGTDEEGQKAESHHHYFGRNIFKLNHDAPGMLLVLLAFPALAMRRLRKFTLFWTLGISLCIVYAVGAHTPLFALFYSYLPGVKNFRAPAMVVFWIPIALAMISAGFLKATLENSFPKERLRLPLAAFALMSIVLVVLRFTWTGVQGFFGALILAAIILAVNGLLWKQYSEHSDSSISNILSGVFGGMKGVPRPILILANLPSILVLTLAFTGTSVLENPETKPYFYPENQLEASTYYPEEQDRKQVIQQAIQKEQVEKSTRGKVLPWAIWSLFLAGGLLFFYPAGAPAFKFLLFLAIAGLADTWMINRNFVQVTKRSRVLPSEKMISSLKNAFHSEKLDTYRILSVGGPDDNTLLMAGTRNAAGFHDNELASYREFRGENGRDMLSTLRMGKQRNKTVLIGHRQNPRLNLSSVRYLIYKGERGLSIAVNDSAIAPVSLYYDWKNATVAEIKTLLKSSAFDYRSVLLLEEGVSPTAKISMISPENTQAVEVDSLTGDSTIHEIPGKSIQNGLVKISSWERGDRMEISAESNHPALLLVTGNWHPYWKATVNGKEKPVLKAFGTFRAIEIPAGKSKIIMNYSSDAVSLSKTLALIGLFIFCLVGILAFLKKNQHQR